MAQITQDEQADLGRGTRITLHLKEDATEMAMASKLNSLIKQYSQYIQFPIRLWNSKQESEQVRRAPARSVFRESAACRLPPGTLSPVPQHCTGPCSCWPG